MSWTDETKVDTVCPAIMHGTMSGLNQTCQHTQFVPTVKHSDGGVMIWARFQPQTPLYTKVL